MAEPANPESPLPDIDEVLNHTPLPPQIDSTRPTDTAEGQKPEPQNPIQTKLQEIAECREQVRKEIERILRLAYGKAKFDDKGQQLIFGEYGKMTDKELTEFLRQLQLEESRDWYLKERGKPHQLTSTYKLSVKRALIDILEIRINELKSKVQKRRIFKKEELFLLQQNLEYFEKQRDYLIKDNSSTIHDLLKEQSLRFYQTYQDLLTFLISDSEILNSVGITYIDTIIKPELEQTYESEPNKLEEIYRLLTSIYEGSPLSFEQRKTLLSDCFTNSPNLYNYCIRNIIQGEEYRILNQFVYTLFSHDISTLCLEVDIPEKHRKVFAPNWLIDYSNRVNKKQEERLIDRPEGKEKINENMDFISLYGMLKIKSTDDWQSQNSYAFKDLRFLYEQVRDFNPNSSYQSKVVRMTRENIQMFIAMKNNSILKNNFKDFFEILDKLVCDKLFGAYYKEFIDIEVDVARMLKYWPTTDTLKLLLLCSSQRIWQRTFLGSTALQEIAKRKDWEKILDQFINDYPELSSLKEYLLTYKDNPSKIGFMRENVQDFVLRVIKEYQNDENMFSIIFSSLSGKNAIDLIFQKGYLNIHESNLLKDLLNIIKENDYGNENISNFDRVEEYLVRILKEIYLNNNLTNLKSLIKYGERLKNIKNLDKNSILIHSRIIYFATSEITNEQFNLLMEEYQNINLIFQPLSQTVFQYGDIQYITDKLKIILYKPVIEILKIITQQSFSFNLPLSAELENKVSFYLNKLQGNKESVNYILKLFINHEIKKINDLFLNETDLTVDSENWESFLIAYIQSQEQNYNFLRLSPKIIEKINELFSDPKVRNICLNGFRNLWMSYLESGKPEEIPFSLVLLTEFIHDCQGAGPLSQIESFSSYIYDIRGKLSDNSIPEEEKIQLLKTLFEVEQRFIKERFSNEDKTEFYNISRDFLSIDLELFTSIAQLFNELTPSQLKTFLKEIYPLYRVMIVLDDQNISGLIESIENLTRSVTSGDFSVSLHKQLLIDEIKTIFKDKMGILKIPDVLTDEHIRSIKNISFYLSNIHDRNSQKEAILSLFLSLKLNGKWDDFILGKDIEINELLTPDKVREIEFLIEDRKQLNPLTSANLGISEDELLEFMKILQQDEEKIVIGSIETVDIKLGNIIINLQGLVDLDLYNNPLDKQRMQLLLDFGNKKIQSTVAKIHQSLTHPERNIQFSEEEDMIRQQIITIAKENSIEITPENLNQYFQNELKPFASVINLLSFINETNAQQEINSLRALLQPSQEVIEVFQRLGEDFKPTSGAMALSQDLEFLQKLVVKRQNELKPEEIKLLNDYIQKIQDKVVLLEEIYSKIKDRFIALRQGMISRENPLLEEKFNQISSIINAQTTQQTITSTLTHDLNTMIENIRECLSCSKGGFNNDTNLTFGDANKFFITSRSETQTTGSIADQIIFLEPITRSSGGKEISFVLDKIYGQNTPTILENHVDVLLSKVKQIKKRFPNIKLSIFITDAALSSSGTSSDMFVRTLTDKKIQAQSENITVNLIRSAFGDHYIEFGGDVRSYGERGVNGIIITV